MLTVVCVEVGNYCQRGAEYVEKLRSMVQRNLSLPHRFVCLTDCRAWKAKDIEIPREVPRLAGWWNKVLLFKPGLFQGRVLYLDLDTVIVGSLDELVKHKGCLHLGRWGWTKNDYGSGVMVWDAGEHEAIWTRYTPDVPARFRGDQDWMVHLRDMGVDEWPALPDGLCVSYRYVSKASPPAGAAAVCFHGVPKPHELLEGWVPQAWV